jgi:acyl dehydratase
MRIFASLDEFTAAKGEHLGHGDWHTVTQEQVDQFADATGDHQWIHVDTEKAAQGPFGTTIAHGYLTLSLIPFLGKEIFRVDGLSMGINYGLGKVRFPSVVPVGARIRAGAELVELTDRAQGTQATLRWTIEVDGNDKPACVAETIVVYVP